MCWQVNVFVGKLICMCLCVGGCVLVGKLMCLWAN